MVNYRKEKKGVSLRTQRKRRKQNPYFRVGARNSDIPSFYRMVIEQKRGSVPLPNDETKRYYIECLKSTIDFYPIEVLAYSILSDKAFLIIASYDQTPVSHTRWIYEANSKYMRYYNKFYQGAGYVFKSKVKTKSINSLTELADSIMVVLSQPYANGLSGEYYYDFSSYAYCAGLSSVDAFGLANLNSFYWIAENESEGAGYEIANNLLTTALGKGPRGLPSDFISIPTIAGFNKVLDEILYDYKIYDKKAISGAVMHRIITELNERGGYTLSYIISKMKLNREHEYELAVHVITDLAMNFSQTFDESINNLGITFNSQEKARETLLDVVMMISNRTSYAYDYIMNMLGLAYPNYDFMKELIVYMSEMRGMSYVDAIKKLGIYDKPAYVLSLVMHD